MSIRLPVDASQNVQAAFRDVEQEIEDLKSAIASMAGGTDLTSITERIDKIQPPPRLDSDEHTFVGSGDQHSVGLVPDPGTSGGDTSRVLGESGGWVYQNVGKLSAADQSSAGVTDIYQVPGALHVAGNVQAGEVTVGQLNTGDFNVMGEMFKAARYQGSSASSNKIVWNATADFNQDRSNYSLSSSTRVVVAKAGTYIIMANSRTSGTAANGVLQIELYKDGSRFVYVDSGASSGGAGGDFMCVIDVAAAGAYYEVFCNDPNPVGESTAKFSIIKVG